MVVWVVPHVCGSFKERELVLERESVGSLATRSAKSAILMCPGDSGTGC
eukprot:CAMPEP_0170982528 /NCGR_PEP_ID=MMETSP0736-20130129/3671_1 /TAXON_ID=186038 /ORGANISM="Fragilariopsis kerguelensis, Strain L26-C5" /LENGTH=48 /DNA_ID= /DNA_START= /DNA_END= /DNA_ORIENTATION=